LNKYVGSDYVLELNGNVLIVSKNDEHPNAEMFLVEDIGPLLMLLATSHNSDYAKCCENHKHDLIGSWEYRQCNKGRKIEGA